MDLYIPTKTESLCQTQRERPECTLSYNNNKKKTDICVYILPYYVDDDDDYNDDGFCCIYIYIYIAFFRFYVGSSTVVFCCVYSVLSSVSF